MLACSNVILKVTWCQKYFFYSASYYSSRAACNKMTKNCVFSNQPTIMSYYWLQVLVCKTDERQHRQLQLASITAVDIN